MNIPHIRIEQQFARTGLEIKKPRYDFKQEKPQVKFDHGPGDLKIKREIVKIKVDNYPACYDLGMKSPSDLGKQIVSSGKKAILDGIARYARQGDRLMAIEQKGGLMEVLKEETKPHEKGLNLGWMRGPKLEVIPADLEIKYLPRRFRIDLEHGSFSGKLHWGAVKVKMVQYAKVKISLPGEKVDITG